MCVSLIHTLLVHAPLPPKGVKSTLQEASGVVKTDSLAVLTRKGAILRAQGHFVLLPRVAEFLFP